MLQQLKHNDPRIVKLAINVMVKILSLGKVGIVNCVVWFLDSPSCMIVFAISYLAQEINRVIHVGGHILNQLSRIEIMSG